MPVPPIDLTKVNQDQKKKNIHLDLPQQQANNSQRSQNSIFDRSNFHDYLKDQHLLPNEKEA